MSPQQEAQGPLRQVVGCIHLPVPLTREPLPHEVRRDFQAVAKAAPHRPARHPWARRCEPAWRRLSCHHAGYNRKLRPRERAKTYHLRNLSSGPHRVKHRRIRRVHPMMDQRYLSGAMNRPGFVPT